MVHCYVRLTAQGCKLLVQHVLSGRPLAHFAAEMGIPRPTGYKWLTS